MGSAGHLTVGDPGQDLPQGLRVASIILDEKINMTVQCPPDVQSPRRLSPETA